MPITVSALRADRQIKKRFERNAKTRDEVRKALKAAQTDSSELPSAYSKLDRAAKKNIIHWRRAARLKSKLARLAAKPAENSTPKTSRPRKTT